MMLAASSRMNRQEPGNLQPYLLQFDLLVQGARFGHGANPLVTVFGWLEDFVGRGWTGNTSALNMTGVHKNQDDDLPATLHAVTFTAGSMVACVALFLFLLHRFPAVYQLRTIPELVDEKPLATPSQYHPFNWALQASNVDDDELVNRVGLDALLLTKFMEMCRRVVMIIGPVIVLVLVPLHWTLGSIVKLVSNAGQPHLVNMISFGRFGILTMTSMWEISHFDEKLAASHEVSNRIMMWFHAAMVFFVVGVACRVIDDAHEEFLQFRWKWLNNMDPPRSTTLLVEGIPAAQRSDASLFKYFAKLFTESAVHRCYVIRRPSRSGHPRPPEKAGCSSKGCRRRASKD